MSNENKPKYEERVYYKGFCRDFKCRDFQYAEGGECETGTAKLCESGFHACEQPHDVFSYYAPGSSIFREVFLGGLTGKKENDSKRCAARIKIGAKISVFKIVEIAVEAFFERVNFAKKMIAVQAGDDSAVKAGYDSAVQAGNASAVKAGDDSAVKAGSASAVQAGNDSAVQAGNDSAVQAGNDSLIKCEECVSAYGGKGTKFFGGKNSVFIILVFSDNGERDIAVAKVDGQAVKENVWYEYENGDFQACENQEAVEAEYAARMRTLTEAEQ
jgi:hypothetical protein